jgi:hypothetical protein
MNTGVVDRFTEVFTRYIDSGFGLLSAEQYDRRHQLQPHRQLNMRGRVRVSALRVQAPTRALQPKNASHAGQVGRAGGKALGARAKKKTRMNLYLRLSGGEI